MSGINATRERLKDQLVIAADEKIRLLAWIDWMEQHASFGVWQTEVPGVQRPPLRQRLARWWARVRA